MRAECRSCGAMAKMAWRTGFLFWALMFLALLAMGVLGVLRPYGRRLKHVRKDAMNLKEKLIRVESVSQGAKDMDVILKRLDAELNHLRMRVLGLGEQAKVISLVTQTTEALNMSIVRMNPVDAKDAGDEGSEVKVKPRLFELEMMTRYKTLGRFFERLQQSPLILTVEEFTAVPEAVDTPLLRVKMVLAAYEETD